MTTARTGGRQWGRSVAAVAAGIVSGVVLQMGADEALRAAGLFPPAGERMGDGMFLLAAAHRAVFSIGSAWLTARLAPDRPMQHALVLGALGLLANAAGVAVAWQAGPAMGPLWYPLALTAAALPAAWAGGWLAQQGGSKGNG